MKKVSIIIPAYNCEQTIHHCLDSICKQTYTNIEIVVIDDGSTDSTGDLCEEYAQKDSRIIVCHYNNSGVSVARNNGIENSSGYYLMFVDSDDWLEPFAVEFLVKSIEESKSDICFNLQFFSNEGRIVGCGDENLANTTVCKDINLIQKHINFGFGLSGWNQIFKRALCSNVRFDKNIHNLEDWDFNSRLLENAKSVNFVSRAYYHYEYDDNSATHLALDDKNMTSFLVLEKLEHRLKTLKIDNDVYLDFFQYNFLYFRLGLYARKGALGDAGQRLQNICRTKFLTLIRSRFLNFQQKCVITLGAINIRLFRFVYNLKN